MPKYFVYFVYLRYIYKYFVYLYNYKYFTLLQLPYTQLNNAVECITRYCFPSMLQLPLNNMPLLPLNAAAAASTAQ